MDVVAVQKALGLEGKAGSLGGKVRRVNPSGRSLDAEDVLLECALDWRCAERRGVLGLRRRQP
jgi:hypothetical protein